MCGVHKKLTELTYAELEQYSLKNSTEKIPLFSDVLELVNGKVPLVVEIKVDFDYKATTEAAAAMLSEYKGVYCMECFNPLAMVPQAFSKGASWTVVYGLFSERG